MCWMALGSSFSWGSVWTWHLWPHTTVPALSIFFTSDTIVSTSLWSLLMTVSPTKWHLRGCKVGRRGGGWLGKNLGWWDLTTSRSLWSCCLFSIQNSRYGEKTKLHNTGFTKYLIIKNKRQITPYFKYLKHVNHLPKLFKFCQNGQKKTQSHKQKNMFGQNSVTCGTNFTLAPEILNNHFSISSKSKLGALSKPGN